ncbi:hypothetical protein PAL_GLEAN10015727 [Pteropus alecto]|uniref:Uncharacterized protein n=1 Tax=Pteropus alecto TaxID=9402 RepID=L5L0G9_PTEAL|nr:hypothetical protein PAL_GLEAN10015727 [Pteropus alecto]
MGVTRTQAQGPGVLLITSGAQTAPTTKRHRAEGINGEEVGSGPCPAVQAISTRFPPPREQGLRPSSVGVSSVTRSCHFWGLMVPTWRIDQEPRELHM